MRFFGYLLQAIGLCIVLFFYVMPVLMYPLVNELPYLHELAFWQRSQLSFFVASIGFLLIIVGARPENRMLAAIFINDAKGKFVTCCGFLGFILLGAFMSANTMGLLVLHTIPTQPYLGHMLVKQMKYEGSKSKSIYLTLYSETNGKTYYLRLAKKLFDYPEIKAGDKMILKGEQNVFGVYVHQLKVE